MSVASNAEAAPTNGVPGFPEIYVLFARHRRDDATGKVKISVRYYGWPEDLIAAGIMSAKMLHPTGKHLRDADGDKVSVTRSWRLYDGAPKRYCTVLRTKDVERLDTLPSAREAVLTYLRENAAYEELESWSAEYRQYMTALRKPFEALVRELGRAIMTAACRSLIERTVTDGRGQIR